MTEMHYVFHVVVVVDPDALAAHNEQGGLQLDPDPFGWSEDNLVLAFEQEIALIDHIDRVTEA